MLLKINALLLSLLFAGVLELGVFKEEWFFQTMGVLILFSVLVVWPLARKIRFLAIPLFLSLGSLSLLYLIDEPVEQHVFILFSTAVYYLALLGAYRLKFYPCDKTAIGMVNLATLATGFFWFVSNYGWYLNFQIGGWVLVLTFVGSTFLIGLPSLLICAESCRKIEMKNNSKLKQLSLFSDNFSTYHKQVVIFLNIIISVIMGELIWSFSLWPFSYLSTGVAALLIYYILWNIIRMFISSTLCRKAVLADIVLVLISIVGILVTTRWELVI
jgi:hypothetical protein